ncbi:MAG: HIT domain-containing protein [Verrucomicrobia bacterium]|nr:HIT domain-containing protein [Verrucomicrobiota bacterium]
MTEPNNERLDRIWAPWRLDYVKAIHQANDEGCIFCIGEDTARDRERHVVVRQPTCFAMLNLYPYNNGHLLVAPRRHVGDLEALSDDELTALMQLVRDCTALLDETLRPQGYNIGLNLGRAAGAGIVEHLHFHIVPRWVGDTNFMPATANTKVMPQSLDALWQLLREQAGSE